MSNETVSLEVAIEVVLRNGPTFKTIAGLYAENVDYGATIDHLTRENAEQIGEIVALNEQRDELLAVLEEAEYALDYASDMTKPEGLSGCDCPICTASIRIGEVLAGKRRQA